MLPCWHPPETPTCIVFQPHCIVVSLDRSQGTITLQSSISPLSLYAKTPVAKECILMKSEPCEPSMRHWIWTTTQSTTQHNATVFSRRKDNVCNLHDNGEEKERFCKICDEFSPVSNFPLGQKGYFCRKHRYIATQKKAQLKIRNKPGQREKMRSWRQCTNPSSKSKHMRLKPLFSKSTQSPRGTTL